jgi:hypothetical protein
LAWNDTAVIEDAAVLLVHEQSTDAMSMLCEAVAAHEAEGNFEEQEAILWVMSPAWESGQVDVPSLLHAVALNGGGAASAGARIALAWLDVSA